MRCISVYIKIANEFHANDHARQKNSSQAEAAFQLRSRIDLLELRLSWLNVHHL